MSRSVQEQRISDAKYTAGTEFERTSKVFTRQQVPAGPPALSVLDIGCGTGVNARDLAAKGHTVTGIDISPVAIEKFRAAGFDGQVCDIAHGTPFPDAAFDMVFASEVIEHLSDTPAFLAEITRLLRPGGSLVLSTPNSAFWAYRLLGVLGRTLTEVQHPGHVRFFSKRGLTRHLEAAGFKDVRVAGRNMWLILGHRVARPLSPLLNALGFTEEMRFKTGTTFWQLSGFTPRASGLWSDTLIITARRT